MGKYDQAMKLLVSANPLAIVKLILRYAGINLKVEDIASVTMLTTEFEGYEIDADGLLLLTTIDGEEILLHIEFQSTRDKIMPDRQIEYCLRARKKHGYLPIISCVIYLRVDGEVPEPPLRWQLHNGRNILLFDYVCIKLWEMTQQELLAFNQPALLPLVLLTTGEVDRILVKELFQRLLDNRLQDVLPVAELLAALVLKGDDLVWLKQELPTMTDLFKDSPAYEWMTEHAREEGREEERQRTLEERQRTLEERQRALRQFREAVMAVVIQRFPTLVRSAQKQVQLSEQTDRLQRLLISLSIAQNVAEAEHSLLHFDDEVEE